MPFYNNARFFLSFLRMKLAFMFIQMATEILEVYLLLSVVIIGGHI